MATIVHLKGNPVKLSGDVLPEGTIAPDFKFVKQDLSEAALSNFAGKIRIVISVPSLDTGVCALETKTFNKKLMDFGDKVQGIIISKDLPFAMKRFCEVENITNVVMASDFRFQDFGNLYKCIIDEGALKGLLARIVWVIDRNGKIIFTHIVNEITNEPDYDIILDQIKKII